MHSVCNYPLKRSGKFFVQCACARQINLDEPVNENCSENLFYFFFYYSNCSFKCSFIFAYTAKKYLTWSGKININKLLIVTAEKSHRRQRAIHLVLYILVTELQLHDVLKRPEKRLIEMKVRKLSPAAQHLHQNVVDEGYCLLGYMPFFMACSLEREKNNQEAQ